MFKYQTIDQKRRLFNLLTGNCHYTNGKLELELKPVFAFLFDLAKMGNGGADRNRTGDLMNAIHALYQLSYSPVY